MIREKKIKQHLTLRSNQFAILNYSHENIFSWCLVIRTKIFLVTHENLMPELVVLSRIQGYHIYGETWTAVMGEQLLCEQEVRNVVDRYTISVKKDSSITVGHLPQKISQVCSMFIQRGGDKIATVTSRWRYSHDLVQGGLEIPCELTFSGETQEILKLKRVWQQKKCLHQIVTR